MDASARLWAIGAMGDRRGDNKELLTIKNRKIMKKILVLMALVASAISMMAQDVIIKMNEEKIAAKIIEISSTEVKYLEASMPDGPTFVLSTDEIATIIFSNGQVKVYKHNEKASVVVQNDLNQSMIFRTGNKYTYNGVTMKGDMYAKFLKNNNAEAYKLYKYGHDVSTAGWVLLGVGVGFQGIQPVNCLNNRHFCSLLSEKRGAARPPYYYAPTGFFSCSAAFSTISTARLTPKQKPALSATRTLIPGSSFRQSPGWWQSRPRYPVQRCPP